MRNPIYALAGLFLVALLLSAASLAAWARLGELERSPFSSQSVIEAGTPGWEWVLERDRQRLLCTLSTAWAGVLDLAAVGATAVYVARRRSRPPR